MSILFIITIIIILLLIIYLIIFKYARLRRQQQQQVPTSVPALEDAFAAQNAVNCLAQTIYCARDDDCRQICSTTTTTSTAGDAAVAAIEYKCAANNVCAQTLSDEQQAPTTCRRDYGFFPILTADEIFQPQWTCLNTRPTIFTQDQEYQPYICAGGNLDKLDPDNLFSSCECGHDKIKVRDIFRDSIPLCIDQGQLPLFPNFTK